MHSMVGAAFALALSISAVVPAAAQQAGSCVSASCPDQAAIDAAQAKIAFECHCDGAKSAGQHMRCARRVIQAVVKGGALSRECKNVVKNCEAQLGCGLGIRPFSSVQTIFKNSCALSSCHSGISRKGGLVLDEEEVSFTSLVDQPSEQPEAASQGLLRVKPGDPGHSFLVRKLLGKGPGDPMPQVGPLLPKSTVKMIAKWIERGAPSTADECKPIDPATPQPKGKKRRVCNNRPVSIGNFVWKPLPALAPPAANDGVQLYVPPRDVEPGKEWEVCYAFRQDWTQVAAAAGYPAGQTPIIREQEYRMHQGSHHLLLYMYFGPHPEGWAQGFFPCFAASCTNPNDCPEDAGQFMLPIGGTQVAGTNYVVQYPQGVGVPVLGKDAVLIADLHYTNPFQPAQPIYGEAWLNLYMYPPGGFKALLDGIFAINFQDLFIEPYETRVLSRVWQPVSILGRQPVDAAVFQLFGHMHKRGQTFQIDYVKGGKCSASGRACGRDDDCACKSYQRNCTAGQTCVRQADAEDTRIYYTTEWDQAPVVDFQPPYLTVNREDGLRWTCTHTNGVEGDPTRPPKRCTEGCKVCGWDAATRTCVFKRGVQLGIDTAPRVYQEGDPMPLVFGELADDDMCNMFGYFLNQADLPNLQQ